MSNKKKKKKKKTLAPSQIPHGKMQSRFLDRLVFSVADVATGRQHAQDVFPRPGLPPLLPCLPQKDVALELQRKILVCQVEHRPRERSKHLLRLLQSMRLGLIARPNFKTKIQEHSLVLNHWDACGEYVNMVNNFLVVSECARVHTLDLFTEVMFLVKEGGTASLVLRHAHRAREMKVQNLLQL